MLPSTASVYAPTSSYERACTTPPVTTVLICGRIASCMAMLIALVTTVRLGIGRRLHDVGARHEGLGDRRRRRAAAEADDRAARDERARRPGDRGLRVGVLLVLVPDRQVVGDRVRDRSAARAGQQLLAGRGRRGRAARSRATRRGARRSGRRRPGPLSASRSSTALSRSARFIRSRVPGVPMRTAGAGGRPRCDGVAAGGEVLARVYDRRMLARGSRGSRR